MGRSALYRCGGDGDQPYNAARGYGYLTAGTVVNICGSQAHQTYRQMGSGQQLKYQFDHLLPDRFYHLDLTFYLSSGSRVLRVLVDSIEVASSITASSQFAEVSLLLEPSLYGDNRIVVTIEKTGGELGGPVISELNLSDVRYCYRDSGHSEERSYATAEDGCGWLPGSLDDQSWGTLPHQSVRYSDGGSIQYRFDQLEAAKQY